MDEIIIGPEIEAFIFDCDGTLVDSMPIHLRAWKESINEAGEAYDEDFIFSLKGMKETEIIQAYNARFGTSLDPESVVNYKHDYFIKHIETVKPIEPIVKLARSHYGKLPMAVVSGGISRIVIKELEIAGIRHLFDKILTADDPFTPKPSPDMFLAAANYLKCNPKNCIVFEDGDSGLEGAAIAGMKTIDVREFI